jgi:hypothetical protein
MIYTLYSRGCRHLGNVFFSDETWFALNGCVDSQNSRIRCAVSRWKIIGPIFFSETITDERYRELIMNLISLLEFDEQDCWFQQDRATAHIVNSTMEMLSEFMVVALFLETCGPLGPRIYRHRISVFGGFWRRTCTKTSRTHQKNWNKILSCAFQTSLQKSFIGLHQTRDKEWMHASLNAVDISNTYYTIFLCFLISM